MMRLLIICLLALLLSLPLAVQAQTDEAQTLLLERYTSDVRAFYGLPAREPSGKIRSAARILNVAPKDGDVTLFAVAVTRALRVATFPSYSAYYSLYEQPGRHEAAEIVASWRDDALISPWIFRSGYAYVGCAWYYEQDRTWAMCIYADLWEDAPTATPLPLPLVRPPMATPRPLFTSTPTPRWMR